METTGLELSDLTLLTDVLTAADSLFWPCRFSADASEAWHACHERRLMFAERGVELVATGDATTRKQLERMIDGLRARGLLVVLSVSGRRVGARLTDAADDWLRGALTLPWLAESWPLLERLADPPRGAGINAGHIGEGSLVDEPHGTRAHDLAVHGMSEALLPAAWRGLVASLSDARGRIGWRLTDRGRAALASDPPAAPTLPEWTDSWRATEDAIYQHYLASADAALKGRERWQRRTPNAMTIPLSAGSWSTSKGTRRAARKPRKAG